MRYQRSVLILGANGYIGSAVCRAFVQARWRVIGLVRRLESAPALERDGVIPLVADVYDSEFLLRLSEHADSFKVIIGCTESVEYEAHFKQALDMIRLVSKMSSDRCPGLKPLVLWSSGCKDYGTTGLHGVEGLESHTEATPLNPPPVLRPRATCSLRMFDYTDEFDAAVLRPTNVYGYSSSYYSVMFEYAQAAAARGAQSLELVDVHPNTILHALHVDDCAEAYVALAEHAERADIGGRCFNISAHKYETTDDVAQALARDFGIPSGAKFTTLADDPKAVPMDPSTMAVFGYSQWVDSSKVRELTGWRDKKPLFTEGLSEYRREWEAAVAAKHADLGRIQARTEAWKESFKELAEMTVPTTH